MSKLYLQIPRSLIDTYNLVGYMVALGVDIENLFPDVESAFSVKTETIASSNLIETHLSDTMDDSDESSADDFQGNGYVTGRHMAKIVSKSLEKPKAQSPDPQSKLLYPKEYVNSSIRNISSSSDLSASDVDYPEHKKQKIFTKQHTPERVSLKRPRSVIDREQLEDGEIDDEVEDGEIEDDDTDEGEFDEPTKTKRRRKTRTGPRSSKNSSQDSMKHAEHKQPHKKNKTSKSPTTFHIPIKIPPGSFDDLCPPLSPHSSSDDQFDYSTKSSENSGYNFSVINIAGRPFHLCQLLFENSFDRLNPEDSENKKVFNREYECMYIIIFY